MLQRSRRWLLLVPLALAGAWTARAEEPPAGGLALMDAVRMTLVRDPNVAIETTRVDTARGSLQIASGQFDPVVVSGLSQTTSRVPQSISSSEETRTLQGTLGVSKEFRTGLILEPSLQLDNT